MAKQTFSVGQVLTAAQMTSLQQTAMLGGAASAKTTSYTLVAADAGTAISMTSTSATTITVNTALFAAGDTVQITNLGTGVCTITAGTATVNTASSLELAQYESGTLDFTSASAAIFIKGAGAAAGGGGKVLQVVQATYATSTQVASTSYTDTGLSGTITPTLATSKILVMATQGFGVFNSPDSGNFSMGWKLARNIGGGAFSFIYTPTPSNNELWRFGTISQLRALNNLVYLDSPATTSAVVYKTQGQTNSTANNQSVTFQNESVQTSVIIMMEIGA